MDLPPAPDAGSKEHACGSCGPTSKM